MAAFNPKPWFKQPIGTIIKTDEKYQPYLKAWDKKNVRFPLAIADGSKVIIMIIYLIHMKFLMKLLFGVWLTILN